MFLRWGVGFCFHLGCSQDFTQSWIDPAIGAISLLKNQHVLRFRHNLLSSLDDSVAGFVDGLPSSCASSRQNRGSVCRSLFRHHDLHSSSVDVCLNLPPETGSSSATAQANPLHGQLHLAKDCETVLQTESHAFQNGTNDVSASMRRRESDKGRARVRIAIWSAFTHQVRRPENAIGPGLSCGCLFA